VSHGDRLVLVLFRQRDQASLAALLGPVALHADVDGGGVMQQPIEDGCCDDRIAEDRSRLSIALVRGQDDRASFVACADQLEEDGGCPALFTGIANSNAAVCRKAYLCRVESIILPASRPICSFPEPA
jgi:hypothetical protein